MYYRNPDPPEGGRPPAPPGPPPPPGGYTPPLRSPSNPHRAVIEKQLETLLQNLKAAACRAEQAKSELALKSALRSVEFFHNLARQKLAELTGDKP